LAPPTPALTPEVPFSNIFFYPTTSSSTGNLRAAEYRSELRANPCYGKLLWLWYLVSVEVALHLVWRIGLLDSNYPLMLRLDIWKLMTEIGSIVIIVWFFTLVFFDQDLQRFWMKGKRGRFMAKRSIFFIGWIIVFVVVFTCALLPSALLVYS